jgi:hypothetical protein
VYLPLKEELQEAFSVLSTAEKEGNDVDKELLSALRDSFGVSFKVAALNTERREGREVGKRGRLSNIQRVP